MTAIALTIAGSDSSGGAGIQADLKTFAAFGVYGASAITALTAQNTVGVRSIADVDPQFVANQIDAIVEDLEVGAAKTGMLARVAVIEAVADRLRTHRLPYLVVDPVMVATSGDVLLEPEALTALREKILPLATLLTPNLREAEILTGRSVTNPAQMRDAARTLIESGVRAVLVKGGHLADDALDILYDSQSFREFSAPQIATRNTHGTGCTLSAAITACLARGFSLEESVAAGKRYITRAIATAPGIGHGSGPVNHFASAD